MREQVKQTNGYWPRHGFRQLIAILFGEQNAINFYKEDQSTEQFEAYAKKRGMTVIPTGSECCSGVEMNIALDRMINPLADAKQKHAKETQKCLSLWDKIKLYRKASNHAAGASDGECVPPVLHLKIGERITHIMIKSPTDSKPHPSF